MKIISIELIGRDGDSYPFTMKAEFEQLIDFDENKKDLKKFVVKHMPINKDAEYIARVESTNEYYDLEELYNAKAKYYQDLADGYDEDAMEPQVEVKHLLIK